MDPHEEGLHIEPLAARARDGDPAAFGELTERFREPLLSYAEAMLRDKGYAEDAVQETLLRAWERRDSLRDPTLFRPWLYSILENAAFSGERYRRCRPVLPLFEGEAIAEGEDALIVPPAPLPGEEPPGFPAAAVVRRSLAALPAPFRRALLLHYVQGRTTREVGEALGITYNNARVRLYRARGALRRELARRGVTGAARQGVPS